MNKNFINMLKGLNTATKIEAVKVIMSNCEEQLASDKDFYSKQDKLKECSNVLYSKLHTSDKFLEVLIKIETSTPLSIFSYIINGENFSDIMFYGTGYKVSDNKEDKTIEIPQELLPIYKIFLNHFTMNIVFYEGAKFDTAYADLDSEMNQLRFNLTHKTLTKSNETIISIRKQTIKSSVHMSDEYLNSIDATEEQQKCIQKYSQKGNFIIFGEVSSGKTTLLNYMANYKLENKKNLCTIEDTAELNVDVPIALLTNNKFKIKDLFKKSLRQNPSSILIGETRTDEIVDILESALTINVGTTIHANSFKRAIQRIIFMSMSRKIDPKQIKDLISASIDCFIFMEDRKIKEIWENKQDNTNDVFEAYKQIM